MLGLSARVCILCNLQYTPHLWRLSRNNREKPFHFEVLPLPNTLTVLLATSFRYQEFHLLQNKKVQLLNCA